MTAATRQQTPADHFPVMLKIASEMGCQLEPTPANPAVLRGLCPFHPAERLSDARTLQVDTRSTRFRCQVCPAQGNPIAFTAMVWGVSASDTRRLLLSTGGEAGCVRPPYPESYRRDGGEPPLQNTAVLTLAARYYGQQLYRSYPALYFLARLALRPEEAVGAGVGYCPGRGLREYLLEHGVSPREAESSPLFHPVAGTENFTGRITLADQDFTGAALWMTSTIPEEPGEKHAWRRRRPGAYGVPGRRAQLLNLHSITSRNPNTVVTDDLRLYAVLAVNNTPAALITQRRRNSREAREQCLRMAGALRDRGLRRAVIAVHDREHREHLAEALANLVPGGEIRVRSQDAIMAALAPHTRDLERFTGPEADGTGEDSGERPEEVRPEGLGPEGLRPEEVPEDFEELQPDELPEDSEELGPEGLGPEGLRPEEVPEDFEELQPDELPEDSEELGPEEVPEDLEELQPEELGEGPEGGPGRAYPPGGAMGWTPSTRSPRLSR